MIDERIEEALSFVALALVTYGVIWLVLAAYGG